MKKMKKNAILWAEAAGFLLLIVSAWLTEALHIPHYIFGDPFTPDWHRALWRTFVVLGIWTWVHLLTRRLLKRLHYLEEFLRVCGWCHKVCNNGEWLTLEEYFNSKFTTQTSHGICPDCLKKYVEELEEEESLPSTSNR